MAGTDTTWTTSEWAMAEIMQNPVVMRRAQEELEQVVGMNNTIEESHLPKLKNVDAIVKEALRPYGPPHASQKPQPVMHHWWVHGSPGN